jgi:DNA-binding phage protein
MSEMRQASMVVPIRESWPNVLQEENTPLRSRLYSLVPFEIGTLFCESLTGYINRLGWTHHVSACALAAEVIIPQFDEYQHWTTPVSVFGTKWAMSLNGAGTMTRAWITALNHLTARSDLHLLTLPSWVGDLPPRWQLRETPAWCPSCLAEWRAQGQPLYQPLLWMIRLVTVCPRHRMLFVNHCPRCQKPQPLLARNNTRPLECAYCATWLGRDADTSSVEVESEELIAWQEWLWMVLKELHAASLATGMLTWKPFFSNIATCLTEQKGYSKLAQVTGIDRTNLYRWVDGDDTYTPTLETILKFCYVCKVTPLQVMNGQLDSLQQTLQTGTELHSPLPRRQNRRVDREQCQTLLQAIIDGREEPLGVYQVAERLGYGGCQLRYHFPEECKLVAQRAKGARKQRKEHYLAQIGEQVRQAVFSVHAQGVYPSQRKLRAFLPGGLMRMPEAREAWRDALRELGFEA